MAHFRKSPPTSSLLKHLIFALKLADCTCLKFIALSGTIGLGIFADSGQILRIAGPGGTLLAFAIDGIIAICVMEGIAEMVGLWPISNAMIEFVRMFVDRDLAII